MADIKKIKIGSTTYSLRDDRIITLVDSGSTTAGTWVASTESPTQNLTAYTDGQVFLYKVAVAGGSTTTTLNIDGLGAKTVYRAGTTKATTQYAVDQYILLVYTSKTDGFNIINDADANSYAYLRQYQHGDNVAGTTGKYPLLARYNLTNKNGSYDTAYSRYHTKAYVDTTTGDLYSKGTKVSVEGHTHSYNNLIGTPVIDNTNQKVKTSSVTFEADDTVEIAAGSNVTVTGDATNKKITIAAKDTTYSTATASAAGLMSATDKSNLDTIVESFTSDDGNTTIDTVKEVLKAFENAPEGTNIANTFAGKSNVGHTHEITTESVAPQGHTHTVTVKGTTGANSGTAVTALTGVKVSSSSSAAPGGHKHNYDKTTGISLTANASTATGRVKYVESVSGSKPSLGGTTTFVTGVTEGSGHLESYDAATDGNKKTNDGARIKYVDSISAGSVSGTGKSSAAPSGHTHTHTTYSLSGSNSSHSTKYMKVTTTAASKGTVGISGGSGSLTSNDTDTGIKYVQEISSTGASASGTAKAGSETHTHSYTKPTGVSLGSNTTASGGVKYIEDVSHTAASLTGTKTFNTDAIKSVTLSASDESEAGPAYVQSVIHNPAALTGTTSFNTDAIKSVALSASTTSTDGPQYVQSVSGGSGSLASYDAATGGNVKTSNGTRIPFIADVSHTAAKLTGTTTFVTGINSGSGSLTSDTTATNGIKYVESISGGSGSLVAYNAATDGAVTVENGKRIPVVTSVTHTGASVKSTANAAPHTHTHNVTVSGTTGANSGTAVAAVTGVGANGTATVLTGVKASSTATFLKTVAEGSGSLVAYDASTEGSAVYPNEDTARIPVVTSLSKDGYTPAGSVTLTSGTAPSMNFNTGTNTDTPYISALTKGSYTPAGSIKLTAGTAPSMGNATTKYLGASASGTAVGANGTGSAAPSGHTHTVTVSGTTGANSGTAVKAVTGYSSFSGGSLTGTKTFNTDAIKSVGGTRNYGFSTSTSNVMHTPTVSKGVLSWSVANASTRDAHTGTAASTGTVGFTAASLGTASTSDVAPAAHTHSYGSSTALTTSSNSGTAITALTGVKVTTQPTITLTADTSNATGRIKYVEAQGTFTAGTTPKSSASFSGTATTALVTGGTTKYMKFSAGTTPKSSASFTGTKSTAVVTSGTVVHLEHTHTATTEGTTASAVTAVAANGTAAALTGVKATSTANVAPSGHTHSYGSSTALTTGNNSGSAVAAVTAINGGSISPTTYYIAHGHTGASSTPKYLHHTHTGASSSTGTVGIDGGSISKTTYYLAHGHTASSGTNRYMKVTPTAASKASVGTNGGSITPVIKYMAATTEAASTGTVGISGGSISKTTKYFHPSVTTESANTGTPSATTTFVTSVTGGTTTATTKYLHHTHNAAKLTGTTSFSTDAIKAVSLSASDTSTDGPAYVDTVTNSSLSLTSTANGGTTSTNSGTAVSTISGVSYTAPTATTYYLDHEHTPSTEEGTGTVTISGGSYSATTKYLSAAPSNTSTETTENSGTNFNAATAVAANGTANVAPSGHTHAYGSSTALTTTTNSGTAIDAVTAIDASTD